MYGINFYLKHSAFGVVATHYKNQCGVSEWVDAYRQLKRHGMNNDAIRMFFHMGCGGWAMRSTAYFNNVRFCTYGQYQNGDKIFFGVDLSLIQAEAQAKVEYLYIMTMNDFLNLK